ncbi:MAG: family 10 glycosylhydrolase [bacterium]
MLKNYLILCLLLIANNTLTAQDTNNANNNLPAPFREMRAVWVATVDNIDWPSSPGLSTQAQQKEIIIILEKVKELNMNAVVLQVRPQADAFYKSSFEPWSYYLTGEQGKAPDPYYDPLEFWIREAHDKGIEVHAWFNPYRAYHPAAKGNISDLSILKTKPNCVAKLGNQGYYWMIPTMQEVQDQSFNVVMEVVNNYDIDGIHFDDYFYPYTEYNDGKDFPDDESFNDYLSTDGKLNRGDWRREAVNKFVKRIYEGIKKSKQYVKFGISPFGFYRPGYPASVTASFDQYETLYADAKLWLNEGWVDYYSPQLYWQISRVQLSYPLLLGWWAGENIKNRNLWPGLYFNPQIPVKDISLEIINQIMVTRGMVPNSPGVVLFSMKSLIKNNDTICKPLLKGPFSTKAIMPLYPWLDNIAPEPPIINFEKTEKGIALSWKHKGEEQPFQYVLYTKVKNNWEYNILPYNCNSITLPADSTGATAAAISAVDRCGNESLKSFIKLD